MGLFVCFGSQTVWQHTLPWHRLCPSMYSVHGCGGHPLAAAGAALKACAAGTSCASCAGPPTCNDLLLLQQLCPQLVGYKRAQAGLLVQL
jgi:hypothetical protein